MKAALIIFTLTLLYCIQVSGTTIHVPADTLSIQAAIDMAANGDTVLVAEGTYIENINFRGKAITVASHFLIDRDTSHISKTIIDGSQPAHVDSGSVVFFDSGEDSTSILCGFTIMNGTGTIHTNIDPDLGLVTSRNGGGIFVDSSGAKIERNIIRDNRIDSDLYATGGGIRAWAVPPGTAVIINNNHILRNVVNVPYNSGGGGIDIYNLLVDKGLYFIKNNIIEYNEVYISTDWKAWGGGIANHVDLPFNGRMEISENIIRHNSLHCDNAYGAGIYVTYWQNDNRSDQNLNPKIYNNLIYKNNSYMQGSAISIWNLNRHNYPNAELSEKPFICNNTIADNKGISAIHIYQSVPLLMNNILKNNNSGNCDFYFGRRGMSDSKYQGVKLFYNAVGDTAFLFRNSTQHEQHHNLYEIDPLFADTVDYYLTPESPCIDAGDDSSIFNDVHSNGVAVWPAMGTQRNDMGAYGGNPNFISDFTTAIKENKNKQSNLPLRGMLYQNYPNPFNPATRIKFTLPKRDYVTLAVYNTTGQKVVTLINRKITAGSHDVQFDASTLPSGIYFYRIQAGEFSQVRKMVLLR